GRCATAASCRGLEIAGALLGRTVEIGVARNAGLFGGRDKSLTERIGLPRIGHRQRPAAAVVVVRAALLVLCLLEVGEHVVIAPADIAELAPTVVIGALAAGIDKAVDGARPSKDFATWLKPRAAPQLRIRPG